MFSLRSKEADIVAGKTARGRMGRGGRATGGAGAASRTVATLRALLGHAARLKLIKENPAEGVRQIACQKRRRRLSAEEIVQLGRAIDRCLRNGEHPIGLAAIRFMLLTGFRRMEALTLERAWLDEKRRCVNFPDTKSGEQVRAIGRTAVDWIRAQPERGGSRFVFPGDVGDGHFVGVVRVLDRLCRRAKLAEVTPHTLRHTFASIAGELGFSELTIAGLLGHAGVGVTQRYVHLDAALALAADQVSAAIAALLDQSINAGGWAMTEASRPPFDL